MTIRDFCKYGYDLQAKKDKHRGHHGPPRRPTLVQTNETHSFSKVKASLSMELFSEFMVSFWHICFNVSCNLVTWWPHYIALGGTLLQCTNNLSLATFPFHNRVKAAMKSHTGKKNTMNSWHSKLQNFMMLFMPIFEPIRTSILKADQKEKPTRLVVNSFHYS